MITVTPSTPAKGPGPGEAAKATVPLHGDLLCAPEAPPSDGGGTPKNLSFTSDSFETLYLKGLAADVAAYDPIVQPKAKQQRLLSPAAPPTHAPRKLSFTDRSFHFLHQRGVFADQIPVYADEVRAQPQPPQPPSPQLQPMRPPPQTVLHRFVATHWMQHVPTEFWWCGGRVLLSGLWCGAGGY